MLFSKFLLASSLPAVAFTFVIPVGQSDGLYEAFVDEHGEEIHRPLNVTGTGERHLPDLKFLDKRGRFPNTDLVPAEQPKLTCGCGRRMDATGCNDAVADLRNQFGRSLGAGIAHGNAWYSIRNNVVAYSCVLGLGFYVSSDTFDDFYKSTIWVSRDCGSFIAGYVFDQRDEMVHGYTIHYPGLDFCHQGFPGDNKNHC